MAICSDFGTRISDFGKRRKQAALRAAVWLAICAGAITARVAVANTPGSAAPVAAAAGAAPGEGAGAGAADNLDFAAHMGIDPELLQQMGMSGEAAAEEGEGAGAGEGQGEGDGSGEGEGEGTGEGEGEGGEEGEGEGEGEAETGIPAMQKRIDKLTARAKTAEEERDAAKAQVEELTAKLAKQPEAVVIPDARNPLADVTDLSKLQERIDGALAMKRWATNNWDGGSLPDGNGGTKEFSAEEVRQIFSNADEIVNVHAPNRRDYLAKASQADKVAAEKFPELSDTKSPEFSIYNTILTQAPELRRFPNYKVVIGFAAKGIVADMKAQQAAAAGGANGGKAGEKPNAAAAKLAAADGKTKVVPGAPPRGGGAAARVPANSAAKTHKQALESAIANGGSTAALADAFLAMS